MPTNNILTILYEIDRLHNTAKKWMNYCAQQANLSTLSNLELTILMQIGMSEGHTRFRSLCRQISIDKDYLAGYALKNLHRDLLVTKRKTRNEVEYALSALGKRKLLAYKAELLSKIHIFDTIPQSDLLSWHGFNQQIFSRIDSISIGPMKYELDPHQSHARLNDSSI